MGQNYEMPRGFFVTGTDTDVGKTWVSLGLVEQLKRQGKSVGVMKPVAAGCHPSAEGLRNEDAELLQQQASLKLDYHALNPYALEPAIAPHIAADEAGLRIDIETLYQHYLAIAGKSDCVVVEGAGGWLVPLNDFQTMADLAQRLALPVILVVGMRLGCINHALLSAETIRARGLALAGWVANRITPEMPRLEENIATLEQRLDAPLLGRIPHLDSLDAATIADHLTLPPEANSQRPDWLL